MSNTARKARKRAGTPLERTRKIGTPIDERIVPEHFDKKSGLSVLSRRVIKRRMGWLKVLLDAEATR